MDIKKLNEDLEQFLLDGESDATEETSYEKRYDADVKEANKFGHFHVIYEGPNKYTGVTEVASNAIRMIISEEGLKLDNFYDYGTEIEVSSNKPTMPNLIDAIIKYYGERDLKVLEISYTAPKDMANNETKLIFQSLEDFERKSEDVENISVEEYNKIFEIDLKEGLEEADFREVDQAINSLTALMPQAIEKLQLQMQKESKDVWTKEVILPKLNKAKDELYRITTLLDMRNQKDNGEGYPGLKEAFLNATADHAVWVLPFADFDSLAGYDETGTIEKYGEGALIEVARDLGYSVLEEPIAAFAASPKMSLQELTQKVNHAIEDGEW